MRQIRPAPTDCPPRLTGDVDADTEAALSWLWAHPDRWLELDESEPSDLGGAA